MPQPRREHSRDTSAEIAARIVTGPDPDRVSESGTGFSGAAVIFLYFMRFKTKFTDKIIVLIAVLLP